MTDKIKQCGNCEVWVRCSPSLHNGPECYGICSNEEVPADIIMNEDEGTECPVYKERNNG